MGLLGACPKAMMRIADLVASAHMARPLRISRLADFREAYREPCDEGLRIAIEDIVGVYAPYSLGAELLPGRCCLTDL